MTQRSTFTYSKMHMLTTLFTLLINSPSSFHCFISSTTDHLLRYWILDVSRFNLLILFSCLLQLECKLHEVRVCVCFVHWYILSLENKAYHMMCVCVKSLSRVQLFVTPWTVAHQAPLSMGFSRQEYWSGLPFPFPGHVPDPGIEPGSPTL